MSPHINVIILKRGIGNNFYLRNEVKCWQTFLYGYFSSQNRLTNKFVIDGIFGKTTEEYTIKFQNENCLTGDGIVGPMTIAKAMTLGYGTVIDITIDKYGPSWPEMPIGMKSLTVQKKHKLFGQIKYSRNPNSQSPESISIINDWQKKYLIKVNIPQLKEIIGAPKSCDIFCNKIVADKVIDLWKTWDDVGLLYNVKTWGGMWVPRLVRGSTTTLSSHAWGTAFDINSAWNALAQRPPYVGEKGSVRELAEVAISKGWYWGAFWDRQDGMHFEYCSMN